LSGRRAESGDPIHLPALEEDIPHSLVLNYVWATSILVRPRGSGKSSSRAAGEWDLHFPLGPPRSTSPPKRQCRFGRFRICERPDIIGNPVLGKIEANSEPVVNTPPFPNPLQALSAMADETRSAVRHQQLGSVHLQSHGHSWFGRHSAWNAAESAKIESARKCQRLEPAQFGDPGNYLGRCNFGQITARHQSRKFNLDCESSSKNSQSPFLSNGKTPLRSLPVLLCVTVFSRSAKNCAPSQAHAPRRIRDIQSPGPYVCSPASWPASFSRRLFAARSA